MTAPPVTLYTTPPAAVVAQQWTDTTKGDQITIARITSITSTYAVDTSVQPLMVTAMVQSLVYPSLTYALLPNQWVVVGPNFEQAMDDATFQALYVTVPGATHAISAAGGPDPGGPLTVLLRVYANFSGNVTITWGDGASDTLAVVSGTLATTTHTYAAGANYTIVVKEVSGTAVAGLSYTAYAAPVSPLIDVQSSAQQDSGSGQDVFSDVPPGSSALSTGVPTDIYTGIGSETAMATPIESVGQWTPDELARIEAGLPPVDPSGGS